MRAKFIGQEMNGRGRERGAGMKKRERNCAVTFAGDGREGGRGGEVCRDRISRFFLLLKRR